MEHQPSTQPTFCKIKPSNIQQSIYPLKQLFWPPLEDFFSIKWRLRINENQILLHKYHLPSGNHDYRTKNCLVDRKPTVVMGMPGKPESKVTTVAQFILWTVASIALLFIFPYSYRSWSLTWPARPRPAFLQSTHMSSGAFLTNTRLRVRPTVHKRSFPSISLTSNSLLWLIILSKKWQLNGSYGNLLYFSCLL